MVLLGAKKSPWRLNTTHLVTMESCRLKEKKEESLHPFLLYGFIQCHLVCVKRNSLAVKDGQYHRFFFGAYKKQVSSDFVIATDTSRLKLIQTLS